MPLDLLLEELLLLDGQVLVVDPKGGHWVKFVVKRVPAAPDRPHGLSYSLTLHDADGNRLVGFDNAHAVGTRRGTDRGRTTRDHRHRYRRIRAYKYVSAADLLADFWAEVDGVLKERGVLG